MSIATLSIDQQIATFLATCRTASLATVGRDGKPHAANVQYVNDVRLRLYWVSSPGAEHSRDIETHSDAAITIYGHDDRPANIHGLQMRGRVEPVEHDEAISFYLGKFPFAREEPFKSAVARQRFYRFTPAWLRWIDNRRSFGWKLEKPL